MNWANRGIRFVVIICCLIVLPSGCTGVIQTVKNTSTDLQTRYYTASYDKVVNGVAEAAGTMPNWKIEDVDEYQGLISIIDSTIWRNNYIKVKVDDLPGDRVRVNLRAVGDTRLTGPSQKEVKEFLKKIDNMFE